ncbi:MAG TPA: nickel pincer cofactor biosynthesis protein LarC [Blastocatellia bacterium]|nr:nickel pincer cofactor biosynthesis protein LarC [Blastocatellia bacterium]
MRLLYFDCFAGASGDMIIGALLDLGLDLEELRRQLASLSLSGYELSAARVKRSGIAATKFDVKVDDAKQPARRLSDIAEMIDNSAISDGCKAASLRVFERLAEAEARVHASTKERVHFHEVGAVDSIIDIVGAVVGFELLGVEQVISSPLRVGRGSVKAAHGLLPVPAPGTAELLRGVPVYAGEIDGEFVTPTGAAIVTTFSKAFGDLPRVSIDRVGYGAGTRDPKDFPNALRLLLCDYSEGATPDSRDSVIVIETNIDDMSPQVFGYVMDRAFALGALDLFMTPAQMKKDRPGVLLSILCEASKLDALADLLFKETTTLGVRYYEAKRRVLERSVETVETRFGPARVKVARDRGRTLHFQPEYDDCLRLAESSGAPLIEVQGAAISAYRERSRAGDVESEADGETEE